MTVDQGGGADRAAHVAAVRQALDLDLVPDQTADDLPETTAEGQVADRLRQFLEERPPHHESGPDGPALA